MFLKLQNTGGQDVWVNKNNIAFFRDDGETTTIVFSSPGDEKLVVHAVISAEQFAALLAE